jgi:hypothetical protein
LTHHTTPLIPTDLPSARETLKTAGQPADSWVDAQAVADFLGVNRDYIYSNAARLGAIRLGAGPRARLRFQLGTALEALTPCVAGRESPEPETRTVSRRRRTQAAPRLGSGVVLLPIRGREAA